MCAHMTHYSNLVKKHLLYLIIAHILPDIPDHSYLHIHMYTIQHRGRGYWCVFVCVCTLGLLPRSQMSS